MSPEQLNSSARESALLELVQNGTDICGYRIQQRQCIFPTAYAEQYHMPTAVDNFPELAVQIGQVAAASEDDWFAMFAAIERGDPCGSTKVFMRSQSGSYVRYWMRFTSCFEEDGTAFFALITMDDVTDEYEEARLQTQNLNTLRLASQKYFTDILTFNLTKNSWNLVTYSGVVASAGTTKSLRRTDMADLFLRHLLPEDSDRIRMFFSSESLEKAFLQDGVNSLDTTYQRLDDNGVPLWYQCNVTRQTNDENDDVLLMITTRSIDAQKAEEARLKNELWLQSEEIRMTTGKFGRTIFYYDIPEKHLTIPQDYANAHGLAVSVSNYPDSISSAFRDTLPETYATIVSFYESIQQGNPSGSCELAFNPPGKEVSWKRFEFATVFDLDGKPRRAIVFVEDVTEQHLQASEIRRLKFNEQFTRVITQHSDRTVYFYDIHAGLAYHWSDMPDQELQPTSVGLSICRLLEHEGVRINDNEPLETLCSDIFNGVPHGAIKVQATAPDESFRWYDIRFTTLFDDAGNPTSAIISSKDVTEQYEQELTYLRHLQTMQDSEAHIGLAEVDLHTGIVETQSGRILPPQMAAVGNPMSVVAKHMLSLHLIHKKDRKEAMNLFSVDFLADQYAAGNRHLVNSWQMLFHDGKPGWIQIEVDLVLDPYSHHQKALFRLTDITREKTEELDILSRSQRDGMTGLLNRATAEVRIRDLISTLEHPGILVLIDLDDLKNINDTFGHNEGDRAIRSISETMKLHFRETDVISRIGGDEFLVFLPGSADNQDAISASISKLLRKLTRMPIGDSDQRRIHCSIGCAVQEPGDTFEDLYKRADIALYSIKRTSKNNYAFYSPEMEETNHSYQAQRLLSQRDKKKYKLTEMQHLLPALTGLYEAVLSFNLTTHDYFLMEEDRRGAFSDLPSYGTIEDFVGLIRQGIHPEDADMFMSWLTGDTLLQAYERSEPSVRQYCRFYNNGAFQWVEVSIVFYMNEDGDLCDFTFLRWADERAQELDQMAAARSTS